MIKLGLIGFPLGHSISSAIQMAGLKSLGLDGTYELLETPAEELVDRIKYLKRNDYNGFNVTIPLKVPIALFLDSVDKYADIAGCANTVKITEDKRLLGYNTDVYGFESAIPKSFDMKGKTAGVLGTGGAARAATIGLIDLGIKSVVFYTRNIINSRNVVDYFRAKFPKIAVDVKLIQYVDNLSMIDVVVNATPIGMRGHSMNDSPLEPFVISTLAEGALVYDIIYNPTKTTLLQTAEQNGLLTVNGLDMLIYQAAKALEIWTGKIPDVKEMKIAALESLIQC